MTLSNGAPPDRHARSRQAGGPPTTARPDAETRVRRRPAVLICMAVVAVLLFAGFCALGTWQVQRRAWKLDLIARVDQRVHAPAVPAPGPQRWPAVSADGDEYRHVTLAGRYEYGKETLTQASTELGSGYWVITPLLRDDGTTVLVNRGFVPSDRRDRIAHPPGDATTVSGLLRISEPGGGFLRHNDPANDRWYSRDVQAIAAARGLADTAPYFVDAAATPGAPPDAWPRGGMTVIAFHNSHLVYAITWYTLALMVAGAAFYTIREERRQRTPKTGPAR
ncbi:SURF1 family protein [Bordetella bronchialis]|uniref:SURF1 family protein n=1 Tax=Bordetella bronchialis TaxID=463025 RepID=UPI003D037F0D